MKRIGILGGAGARAGARAFDLLIGECLKRGARKDSDFPQVVLFSMNSAGMDETGVINSDEFRCDLQRGINVLRRADCSRILIACNTAHIFHSDLQRGSPDTEILDMPTMALAACDSKPIGVLCSRSAREVRLFGNVIYSTDACQSRIDTVIGRVISGWGSEPDRLRVLEAANKLRDQGAKSIILGCTELPLVMHGQEQDFIDPMRVAVQQLLA